MKLIQFTDFGKADVLQLTVGPIPEPAADEVSIDVAYAAVGLIDVLFRRGELKDITKLPFTPGIEVAGTIRQVGNNVTHLHPGQPVVTLSRPSGGGYAEVAIATADLTIPLDLPDGSVLDPIQAVAALPNTVTALAALQTVAHAAEGESMLINGAAGGLASVFPGVAQSLGIRDITGTVSNDAKRQIAEKSGYTKVLLADELSSIATKFDIIVDPVGGQAREASLALLKPLGRLLAVGNASNAPDVTVGINNLWLANATVHGFNVGGLLAAEPKRAADLAFQARELIANGGVHVETKVMSLAQASEAQQLLESRQVSGKLVLKVTE